MAITGSFRQQCPSCEANVSIKDVSLVGKKVECPKCKYRFVVENPVAKDKEQVAAADKGKKPAPPVKAKGAAKEKVVEADEPEEKGRKGKKKAAAGNNTKLYVGLGLAGVGVIALVAAGIFLLFSGGSDKTPPGGGKGKVASSGSPKLPVTPATQTDDQQDDNPEDDAKGKAGKKGGKTPPKGGDPKKGKAGKEKAEDGKDTFIATGAPAGVANTSFLPPNSEAVYHARFKDFLDSPLGKSLLFEPAGPLKDAEIQKRLGLSLLAIDDILTAQSFSENWAFHVIHTTQLVNDMRPLIQALDLKPWSDKSTKYTCYEVSPRGAAWIETLTLLPIFVPAHALAEQPRGAPQQLLLHMRDPQTLIFAHREPMMQYLQADGVFAPSGGVKGGLYQSIKPIMRASLDVTQASVAAAGEKILFGSVTELRSARLSGRNVEDSGRIAYRLRPFWDVVYLLEENTDRIEYAATVFLAKDLTNLGFGTALFCNTPNEAQQLQSDLHDKVAPQLVQFFKRSLDHKLDIFTPGLPGDIKTKAKQPAGIGKGQPPLGPGKTPPPTGNTKAATASLPNTIQVGTIDKVAIISVDLSLNANAAKTVSQAIQMAAVGLIGEAEAATGRDYRFALAEAGKTLGEKGLPNPPVPEKTFPPGVFGRAKYNPRTDREPAKRISWMAGLLPYMGEEALFSRIRFDKPWNEGDNLFAAHAVVPQFLDPSFPLYSRYVDNPAIPLSSAATHYVGISGIGLDSLDAKAGDKAMAGRLGIFGYDRMTPLKAIAENGRGLGNTVLMIRVPYDGPAGVTPWMAGGGSTIRSVPDKDSLAPFLSKDSKGEEGTYVAMADGSVRYIKKGMSDEVFKAICTVDSPTPAGWKFDEDYPALKPPKAEVTKPLVGSAVPPPTGTGKGTPAPPPKQVAKGGKGDMPAGWQEYTHLEGGFSVSMPPGAGDISLTNTVAGRPVTVKGYLMTDTATKHVYTVFFHELPKQPKLPVGKGKKGPLDKTNLDQIFNGAKQGMIDETKGTIKSEKQITLGAFPGREYELDGESIAGPVSVVTRIYVTQDRLYSLNFASQGSELNRNSPEFSAFFDSFKVNAK